MEVVNWRRKFLYNCSFLNEKYLTQAGNNDLLGLVVDAYLCYLLWQSHVIDPVGIGNAVDLDGIGFSGYY
jgi:hypothetical protein